MLLYHLMKEIKILYHDQDLVAVHKPAGIPVHRSQLCRGDKHYVLQMVRNQIGQRLYPVHRLDKPVSGLLVFALSHEMAQRLSAGFRARQVHKSYVAVVRGYTEPSGHIDYPLNPDVSSRKPAQARKPALTFYQRLAEVELPFAIGRYASSRYCLVRVSPITGRGHQIRRHFKHIHHPVIGDSTYGDGKHNRFFRDYFGCRRLLLFSMGLLLDHPRTGDALRLIAPLDESFSMLIRQMGWTTELLIE